MPHGAQSWNDGTTVRLWPPHGNGFLPAGQRKYGPLPPQVEEAFFMLARRRPPLGKGLTPEVSQRFGPRVPPQATARGLA